MMLLSISQHREGLIAGLGVALLALWLPLRTSLLTSLDENLMTQVVDGVIKIVLSRLIAVFLLLLCV